MRGIVLAGSYRRGDAQFDGLRPRPLVPVGQVPLIGYALRWFYAQGIGDVTICTNSSARQIRQFAASFRPGPPGAEDTGAAPLLSIDYVEDWMPRGAAGCTRDAAARSDASTFVVIDGTSVPLFELEALLETHRSRGAAMTVVAHPDPSAASGGTGLRPSGAFVLDRRVLAYIPDAGFQDVKESLIPRLYGAGEHVVTHVVAAASPRVVSAGSYLRLDQWMVERLAQEPGAAGDPGQLSQARIHPSASVAPGARLVGPVLVGPGASVEDGATVIGPASVGARCVVREAAVVSRSTLWDDAAVGEGARVDRCLMAEGATVDDEDSAVGVLRVAETASRVWSFGPWPLESLSPGRLLSAFSRPVADQI